MRKLVIAAIAGLILTGCGSVGGQVKASDENRVVCLKGEVNGSVTNSQGTGSSISFPAWVREIITSNPPDAEGLAAVIDAACPYWED